MGAGARINGWIDLGLPLRGYTPGLTSYYPSGTTFGHIIFEDKKDQQLNKSRRDDKMLSLGCSHGVANPRSIPP